jgi:hypothetical protein
MYEEVNIQLRHCRQNCVLLVTLVEKANEAQRNSFVISGSRGGNYEY